MDGNKDYFIGCDWGTSSLRLAWVHRSTGALHTKVNTSLGTKKIYQEFLERGASSQSERRLFFLSHLLPLIQSLGQKVGTHTEGVQVVISGMASSSIGVEELSYTSMPYSLDVFEGEIGKIEPFFEFPYSVYLISGVERPGDVMRGEEVQVIGLHSLLDFSEYLVILPGTHSKHISVSQNVMTDFSTFMTGELFELLRTQSILVNSLPEEGAEIAINAFELGVQASKEGNVLNQLFAIRANDLQKRMSKADSYAFMSGLLIGQELKSVSRLHVPIFVIGASQLKLLYEKGLKALGFETQLHELPVDDPDKLSFLGQAKILADLQKAVG